MVRNWRETLGEIVQGSLEGQEVERVVGALQARNPARRARAFRELGARAHAGVAGFLAGGLGDVTPGVRRAAAWAMGWRGGEESRDALLAAAAREICDAPRWTMGVAAVRCGAPVDQAWALVEAPARRQLQTWCGARAPAPLAGAGVADLDLLWTSALCPGAVAPHSLDPVDPEAAHEGARARVRAEPDDRQALMDLAVFEHPDDLDLLMSAMRSQGRRMRHTGATALGLCGDPRAMDALLDVLVAIDVDPGHGFAGRATAATALGRLGLPRAMRPLLRAMRDEALDHEGRPGAGLGIQRPVRVFMLHALGEIGNRSASDAVAAYIGNTTGTPSGGYYLPAMDALVKLGAGDAAAALLGADETTAANALGVLGALGRGDIAAQYCDDSRSAVASVAAALVDADG